MIINIISKYHTEIIQTNYECHIEQISQGISTEE